VGSGGSDYLDFIGEVDSPLVLEGFLAEVLRQTPDSMGFLFFHIRENSPAAKHLQEAAGGLGLTWVEKEGGLLCPVLDLSSGPEPARHAAAKQSLRRHENGLRRDGTLVVEQFRSGEDILPHLDSFFDQHCARWEGTPYPSLFRASRQRDFYRRLTSAAGPAGWLRFTRVSWNGLPVAYHYNVQDDGIKNL
jgi:hypothetical protein